MSQDIKKWWLTLELCVTDVAKAPLDCFHGSSSMWMLMNVEDFAYLGVAWENLSCSQPSKYSHIGCQCKTQLVFSDWQGWRHFMSFHVRIGPLLSRYAHDLTNICMRCAASLLLVFKGGSKTVSTLHHCGAGMERSSVHSPMFVIPQDSWIWLRRIRLVTI